MSTNHIAANETWQLRKPSVVSPHGVVTSQHYAASEIGASVLRDGGNAVDAAIATGFAISTVEPWMSGVGGCGCMVVYRASDQSWHSNYFGVSSPAGLRTEDYPLTGDTAGDLFSWPGVKDNRNVYGPYSIAVPGYVAGMDAAHQQFGTRPWSELLAPAVSRAQQGMDVDWYATLKITSVARQLAQFSSSRDIYLPNGFPPVGEWGGALPRIQLTRLADTLEQLAHAGASDFYTGDLAASIVADARDAGCELSASDLNDYQVDLGAALTSEFAGATVAAVPGLTAGPTLTHALTEIAAADTSQPAHVRYAQGLTTAWSHRLETMGHDSNNTAAPSCTTHISVADREGNVVSLTQTLLSLFGSSVVFDRTGILMNNGIMWFDPRQGLPNSLAPGVRPLSNMCPAIVQQGNRTTAVGASGGRRIVSAVTQVIAFLVQQGLSLDEAAHAARIDVSGSDVVTVDARLDESVRAALAERYTTELAVNGVYPALFACPNIAGFDSSTQQTEGAAYVASPWARAVSA